MLMGKFYEIVIDIKNLIVLNIITIRDGNEKILLLNRLINNIKYTEECQAS